MVDVEKYLNTIGTDDKKNPTLDINDMNRMYNMLIWNLGHKTVGEEYQPSESCYKVQNENTAKIAELMRLSKLQ